MDHFAEAFFDVPDNHGDLTPDILIHRVEDHGAGTVHWFAREPDSTSGLTHLYERRTPNTPEWEAQVKEDLRQVIADVFGVSNVTLTKHDGDDW